MAEMSRHGIAAPASTGWTERIRARPGPPAAAGGLLLVVASGLSAGWSGDLGAVFDRDAPLGLAPGFRFQLVLIALISLSVWARFHEFATSRQHLAELGPSLSLTDTELQELLGSFLDRTRPVLFSIAGALFGVAVVVVTRRFGVSDWGGWRWNAILLWSLPINATLFALLAFSADQSVRVGQFFSELGRNHVRIHLLDPAGLQPFARRGLDTARFWFIGSALAVLLLVGASAPGLIASIIAGTFAIGVVSLVVPSVGIHQQLRERKQQELAQVRALIEERSAELLEGHGAPESDLQLPALLAYEARIDDVREWPFDTPNLLRFALFLLIPLGSWLGGALVERLVDAALS